MLVMTTSTLSRTPQPLCGEFDPFVAPQPSHPIADAPLRARVVVRGMVVDVRPGRWVGGPVLKVTVSDGTGSVCLAFLGRRRIAGVELGRVLTAAGTVGSHHGRATVINPLYWLHCGAEVPDA